MISIHQDLALPSRYRIRTQVKGLVRIGKAPHDLQHIELREMATETLGQLPVYAIFRTNHSVMWEEVTKEVFQKIAIAVITGENVKVYG